MLGNDKVIDSLEFEVAQQELEGSSAQLATIVISFAGILSGLGIHPVKL